MIKIGVSDNGARRDRQKKVISGGEKSGREESSKQIKRQNVGEP